MDLLVPLDYYIPSLISDYGYGSEESKKLNAGGDPSVGPSMSQQSSVQTGLMMAASSTAGTPTTVCYEYSYPDSNSNHSKSGGNNVGGGGGNNFLRPASEHHYEQPMVVFPTAANHEESSVGKPSRSSADDTTGTTTSRGSTQPDRGALFKLLFRVTGNLYKEINSLA